MAPDNQREENTSCRSRYLKSIQSRTCCHFLSYLFLIFGLSNAALNYTGDLIQGDPMTDDPFQPAAIANDMIRLSEEQFDTPLVQEDETTEFFYFLYQWKDGRNADIFNSKNLQTMCEIEKIVFRQSDFNSCDPSIENKKADNTTGVCVEANVFSNIVAEFYRSYNSTFNFQECRQLTIEEIENKTNEIYDCLQDPVTEFNCRYRPFTDSVNQAKITRSTITISHPDEEVRKEVVLAIEEDLFEYFDLKSGFGKTEYSDPAISGDLQVFFFNGILVGEEINKILFTNDFLMAVGSLLAVGIWMGLYTKSVFLAVTNMTYIVLSIPTALFIYKVLFQIGYFDSIHVLVIFIILGIGADSVFVAVDSWKQSRLLFDDEFERLEYSYDRTVSTVFATSFTTIMCFVVTAFTPIIFISTFGIFAALCVAVNFCFICTIVPATILIWERKFVKKDVRYIDSDNNTLKSKEENKEELEALVEGNSNVFQKLYVPCMLKLKYVVPALGVIIGILGGVGVIVNFSPLSKTEEFLPEDHQLTIAIEEFLPSFLGGEYDAFAPLKVFWGVEKIERNYMSRYQGKLEDVDDKLYFDEAFDLSDFKVQEATIEMCKIIEEEECDKSTCEGYDSFALPSSESYNGTCPMRDFHVWHLNEYSSTTENINRTTFNERIKEFIALPEYAYMRPLIGIIDGKVKYFAIEYRMTLPTYQNGDAVANYKEILDKKILPKYEQNNKVKSAGAKASTPNYHTPQFAFAAIQDALAQGVSIGLAITFPIVFLVLIYSTGNFILAVVSCLSIMFTVLTVLGFVFTFLEWELGTTESIAAIMIVGLSVDYAIHLGHMYTHAAKEVGLSSREDRFQYSAVAIGPTVVAGAATTLFAGVFLFGAQLIFFAKMGVLLTLTVCCSLFFSLFFLMGFLAALGPENSTGDVSKLTKYCKKSSAKEDSPTSQQVEANTL